MTNNTQRGRRQRYPEDRRVQNENTPYLRHARKKVEEQNSFIRVLSIMTIIFIAAILSIFILADNENFLESLI